MNQDLNKWLLLIPVIFLIGGCLLIIHSKEISDFVCNNWFSCIGKESVNCITVNNIIDCVWRN